MLITSKLLKRSLPLYRIYTPPSNNIPKELDLYKKYRSGVLGRPLTFDEKCLIINDPKMIAHVELVQYGMTFKPTNKLPVFLLLLGGIIITYLYKNTPHPISERYFAISQQSDNHKFGYFGSMFSFNSLYKVILYAPAYLAVLISSRYLKSIDFAMLIVFGCIGNYVIGTQQVQKKIKGFEVWDRYKLTSGEDLIISIITTLLCFKATSIPDLLKNPRLKLFFKAIPGFGITSSGISIILPLLFYISYEAYQSYRKQESGSLLAYYVSLGIVYGFSRRFLFKLN